MLDDVGITFHFKSYSHPQVLPGRTGCATTLLGMDYNFIYFCYLGVNFVVSSCFLIYVFHVLIGYMGIMH